MISLCTNPEEGTSLSDADVISGDALQQSGICSMRLFCSTPQVCCKKWASQQKLLVLLSVLQHSALLLPHPRSRSEAAQPGAGGCGSAPSFSSLLPIGGAWDPHPNWHIFTLSQFCTSICSTFVVYWCWLPTFLMAVQGTSLRIKPELQRTGVGFLGVSWNKNFHSYFGFPNQPFCS